MANQFQGAVAAPTIVSGARAVSDVNSVRVKVDVRDDILEYDSNANSLTLLTVKTFCIKNHRKKGCTDI